MSKYTNRELSLLQFQQRVVEEARDTTNPLLERAKFLAIVSSNLDEFFMVRIAKLIRKKDTKGKKLSRSNSTHADILKQSIGSIQDLYEDLYNSYSSLLPLLADQGLSIIQPNDYSTEDRNFLEQYCHDFIFPVLTPIVLDQSNPFPFIQTKSLNIAVLLKHKQETRIGIVEIPSTLNRIIPLPSSSTEKRYALLEEVILDHISSVFDQVPIQTCTSFRITRNADDKIKDTAEDLLLEVKQTLNKQQHGSVIRLEINKQVDKKLLKLLKKEFELKNRDIYFFDGPIDLTFLFKMATTEGFDHLRFEALHQIVPEGLSSDDDLFASLSKQDYILHTPYHKFDPIIHFLQQAAVDPNVTEIKQTLYRVSSHSPIVDALALAAQNGKQVTVIVELKARFDEEKNVHVAERLEQAGCHVIYGVVGLKIHGKLLMVVRKEADKMARYVHLGTGNYNDSTAKFYTDLSLFTKDETIGEDVSTNFNMLSGSFANQPLHKLFVAPYGLRKKLYELIDEEIAFAQNGGTGKIIVKVNALMDSEMINKLYEASQKGVKIDLIVRGICGLIPGIEGLSENITVRSIVGQFLEHSRIIYFHHNGDNQLYLSSADWMKRNFDRRFETLFPIENPKLRQHFIEILDLYLQDNVKAYILESSQQYRHPENSVVLINAQNNLWDLYSQNQHQSAKLPVS